MSFSCDNGETEVQVIKLAGPLLGRRTEALVTEFRRLSRQGIRHLVVDLAEVPFIDSRGLAILVTGYRIFGNRPQNFRLAALQDQPQLVLQLTGFDHIFDIFKTVAEALNDKSLTSPDQGMSQGWPSLGWRSTVQVAVQEAIPVRR